MLRGQQTVATGRSAAANKSPASNTPCNGMTSTVLHTHNSLQMQMTSATATVRDNIMTTMKLVVLHMIKSPFLIACLTSDSHPESVWQTLTRDSHLDSLVGPHTGFRSCEKGSCQVYVGCTHIVLQYMLHVQCSRTEHWLLCPE
jgi:hypothetical protein